MKKHEVSWCRLFIRPASLFARAPSCNEIKDTQRQGHEFRDPTAFAQEDLGTKVKPYGCHLALIFIRLPLCRLTHFPWGNRPDASTSTTAAKEAFSLAYFPLRNVLKSVLKAFSQIQGIECSETQDREQKRRGEEMRFWHLLTAH